MTTVLQVDGRPVTFVLNQESGRWSCREEQQEGNFPLITFIDDKRYELYSDGTFAEVEKQGRAANKKKHKREHREREAGGGVAGALAGAALGAIAGPPGVAVGAVLGAVAGSIAEVTIERNFAAKQTENDKLDAAIGMSGGELGAPNLKHPPAEIGAYSGSSAGTNHAEDEEPADGPIQPPPD